STIPVLPIQAPHNAWVKAEREEDEKRRGEVGTATSQTGMKAQECPVRRCGGSARRSDLL
ncbi:hypothetical protein INR49_032913, partial [Caranx melampygus]